MRETRTILVCDICKEEIAETIEIAEGRNYVILDMEIQGKENHFFIDDVCDDCNREILNKFFDLATRKGR